ncbi:nuclear transport factor 2 family protein [Kibdelosporangium phytohabitans]|nr:nuclear transport factor 2 family protein [Kibdelosporangium phytohabitans]MBE1470473.1 ketosteroid isomerase-like protein [Kibdelosporangium phytohabitans]
MSTHAIVERYFDRVSTGDRDRVVELFADTVHWDIPGATDVVPWIGPRRT